MATSVIVFTFVNFVLGLAVMILWVRTGRPQKEDPRLSRGLQLLQSKIAVLEDLSDRTDHQVKQLVQILEERAKGLSGKILQAQELLSRVDHSVAKSLEVADIFQDKIPHEEIIERQNTSRYVQAAKLAHGGMPAAEIAKRMGIPLSEVEFIAKVNKDELVFEPEALPKWAKSNGREKVEEQIVERVFQSKVPDLTGLDQVRANFSAAVGEHRRTQQEEARRQQAAEERRRVFEAKQKEILASAKSVTSHVTKSMMDAAGRIIDDVSESAKPVIKKVQFPRLDGDNQ